MTNVQGGFGVWIVTASLALGVEPNEAMLKELQPFHGVVGAWKGVGESPASAGWNEEVEVTWGFREKDGRVSLNFYAKKSKLLEAGLLTFDVENKQFEFIGKDPKGKRLHFKGKPGGAQSIKLLRVGEETTDGLDRLEIKLVREGDKFIYAFAKKKGRLQFDTLASVELFREGTPLDEFKSGPRCVVTGGAGRLTVEHKGASYPVACEGAKEEFFRRPEKYTAKAKSE